MAKIIAQGLEKKYNSGVRQESRTERGPGFAIMHFEFLWALVATGHLGLAS